MSFFNTRQALLKKLVDSAVVAETDINYENKSFDPTGKSLWLSVNLFPTTDEMLGKTSASRNLRRGFFQISVFVKKNEDNFDNVQLQTMDTLISEFKYGSQATFGGQVVDILESTVTSGSTNNSWYKRDITINYMTFATR